MRKGMSLLEVLVSMVVLGLAASAMFAVFGIVKKGPARASGLEIEGLNYARDTLERLRNNVSANPVQAALLNAGSDIADPLPDTDFKNIYAGTRVYTVEDIDQDNNGMIDYKRVIVTVRWND